MSRIFPHSAALAGFAAACFALATPHQLQAQATEQIACGISSGARQTCNANGQVASVRLTRNLGDVTCRQNSNWGFTGTSLWTSGGCRGDFTVTYRGGDGNAGGGNVGGGNVSTRVIPCGNRTGRHECKTNGYATSVRILADRSADACRQNDNWGFTDSFVWTNSGCWGQFEVTYRSAGGGVVTPNTRMIACGSASGDNSCNAFGRVATVRLVRTLSGNCRQGSTWGYGSGDIWTKRGCRGNFEVTYMPTPTPQPR